MDNKLPPSTTQEIIDNLSLHDKKLASSPTARQDPQERAKRTLLIARIVKIVVFAITVLAFTRIPYVGSYLDGLVDYLLGFGKYLFYSWLIFLLIGLLFNTPYSQIIRTKRFIIFSLVALLSACCVVSGVTGLIKSTDGNKESFVQMINGYNSSWVDYLKRTDYAHFFNFAVTGGLLAQIIAYGFVFLSNVVLIIVALVILLLSLFVILNVNYRSTKVGLKIRDWLVERLGGTFKSKGYNELRDNRINKVKLEKPDAEKIKAAAAKGETIPFGLLPDTDIEKYKSNFKIARKIQTKLKLLFKAYKINCKTNDINVYTSYTEVCFEAKTKEDIASIVKLQPKIAKVAHVNHFNISIRGMILYIELGNLFKSKMSLKTVLSLLQDKQSVRAVAGMRKDGSLINQDFKTNPSALIVGKKGSGSSTLAILMALSVCYTTSPNDLELVVLNANFEPGLSALTSLPHVAKKACESLSECTNKLLELQNLVIERTSLLKASGVADINKYNKSKTNPEARLKHVLVVIGNVEGLIKNDLQNNRIITDILINGKNTGVYMLMQTYGVTIDILNKDIYNNISDKYMLKVASQEESRLIFNSNRAFSQLHSGGDCLHFKANNFQQSQRLQICDINFDELVFDIDIINTFYNARITSKIVSR